MSLPQDLSLDSSVDLKKPDLRQIRHQDMSVTCQSNGRLNIFDTNTEDPLSSETEIRYV